MCIHFAFSSPKKKCLSLQMIGNNIQLVSTREVLLSLKHILVKMMMSSPFHLLYVTLLLWIKLVFFFLKIKLILVYITHQQIIYFKFIIY